MYKRGNKENLQYAFDFAEKELNVTKLLDPEGIFKIFLVNLDKLLKINLIFVSFCFVYFAIERC